MSSSAFSFLRRMLVGVLGGALCGFLVWRSYFLVDLPSWLIHAVANKRFSGFLTAVVRDPAAAENVVIGIFYLMKSLPGALVLGTAAGVISAKCGNRWLVAYSSVAWPILFTIWHALLDLYLQGVGMLSANGVAMRRYEQISVQFIMYSSFLLVFYASSRLMRSIFRTYP